MQIDGSEWSWNNLNTLCWAIGSISGAMSELIGLDVRKRELTVRWGDRETILSDRHQGFTWPHGDEARKRQQGSLRFRHHVHCWPIPSIPQGALEIPQDSRQQAIRVHAWNARGWVSWLSFEYLTDNTGVQDMACDTFIKIAQKCRRHFVMQQAGEQEPFIDEILRTLHRITVDLAPQQVCRFPRRRRIVLMTGSHILRGCWVHDFGTAK